MTFEEKLLREIWGEELFKLAQNKLNKSEIPDQKHALTKANPPDPVPKTEQTTQTAEITKESLIGQLAAKATLEQVISISRLNIERQKRKMAPVQTTLHAVFAGSPGTGKTTFARYYAQEVKRLGLLKKGQLVEVSRSDLIAEFAGQTATKTRAVVEKALGGILFIDEAYALKSSKDDAFGQECIDTLVKMIEDHRNDLVVILAGYTEEMRNFLHHNTGLQSRIPHFVMFDDYTDEELGLIFDSFLKKTGVQLKVENRNYVLKVVAQKRKSRSFGNAREIRNIFEKSLTQQAMRLSKKDVSKLSDQDILTLIYSDFTEDLNDDLELPPTEKPKSVTEKFDSLVGLESVKKEITQIENYLKVHSARNASGKKGAENTATNLHLVFAGPPGTGKSTVARMMGSLYRELGLLGSGHVIEVDRSDLVAGYVGQTAIKTAEKIKEALGGVLFVDEAYALSNAGTFSEDTFGQEAINTLLKAMEDNKSRLAVIFAGYKNEMNQFLSLNPGLKSRIGSIIEFPDYSLDELLTIAHKKAEKSGYKISPDGEKKLLELIVNLKKDSQSFGNARTIENIFEDALKKQATRLIALNKNLKEVSEDEFQKLTADDFTIDNLA
jgi:SpoVK/Ycf46/Vps4 family AAA+-type ATPase